MSFKNWANERVAKMDWLDVGLTKWCMVFFALAIAKLWPEVLGLDWYWYALVFVLLAIRPLWRIYIR